MSWENFEPTYGEGLLTKILQTDNPWSLKETLLKLIEASNILLINKSYDGHGWELINQARDKAEEIIDILNNPSKYVK